MKGSFDIAAMLQVFERLEEYVRSESSLAEFRSISTALLTQAQRIGLGDLDIEVFTLQNGPTQLPSRDCAQRLIEIMASLPALEPTEPSALIAAYAALLGGLAGNITYIIYRDFPDVVPRR